MRLPMLVVAAAAATAALVAPALAQDIKFEKYQLPNGMTVNRRV